MENYAELVPDFARDVNCAVTICDTEGIILYMNNRAIDTYRKHGNLIGQCLFDCHNERSRRIIHHMLETGEANAYTITKHGQRKMIYQTPWRRDGRVAGLIEISMVIPSDMPHYDRDKGE